MTKSRRFTRQAHRQRMIGVGLALGLCVLALAGGAYWYANRDTPVSQTRHEAGYKIPNVPNYNQYAEGAPVGCEGVSLYQALWAKGYATNVSLHAFLATIPKAATPDKGFVGSPFVADAHTYTSIYPAPLAAWGRQFGRVTDISGQSVAAIETAVLAGDPVVAYVTEHFAPVQWGTWQFGQALNNNHAVTVAGFNQRNRQLFLSDPIDGQYWIAESEFAAAYNARHMAVVVR